MESMKALGSSVQRRREGVSIKLFPASERDTKIENLDRPWVAEEGPLELRFGQLERPKQLLLRGLAFDAFCTVTWDEDGVEVITPAESDDRIVALESPVLVRSRFADAPRLLRIDYFKDGVWLASRYRTQGDENRA